VRRALALLAAALLAGPAFGQTGRATLDVTRETVNVDGSSFSYSALPLPAGCTTGSVATFLGSLTCVPGLTYNAATDTLTTGTLAALNVTATGLPTPGSITVTPTLSQVGWITVVGPAVRATGLLTVPAAASLSDTETFSIHDGSSQQGFEFDTDAAVDNVGFLPVDLTGLTTAEDVAAACASAINGATGPGWTVEAIDNLDGTVTLRNTAFGAAGNAANAEAVGDAGFILTNMTGGADGIIDGDALSVGDGTGIVPIEFDFAPGNGTTGGAVAIVFDGTESATDIRDAVKAILDGAGRDWTTSAQGADGIGLVRATPGATGGAIAEDVTAAGFSVTDWTPPAAATTYTYSLQACAADGACTAAGAASTTALGVATLSALKYNALSWSAVTGAASYKIRRDVGGATQGVIWSGIATTVDDTGLAGDSSAKPLRDGTGILTGDWYSGQRLPDGSIVLGEGTWTPLCSYVAASISAVSANTSTLSVPGNTCPPLRQGDIVAVTSAAVSGNRGLWQYTGVSATSSIEVLGVMTSPDVDIGLTVYRGVTGVSADGRLYSMSLMTKPWRPAHSISYYVNQSTGGGAGLQIHFGSSYGSPAWGDGETSHHPLEIYRSVYRSAPIFYVNALGSIYAGGNVTATSGRVEAGSVKATSLAAPASAPTVTPIPTTGAATWSYRWVPTLADGTSSGMSSEGSTVTGPATLTSSDRLWIQWTCTAGTYAVDVYRTVSGGTPASLGKVGSVPCPIGGGASGLWDDGLVGDGTSAPAGQTTGYITAAQGITAGNNIVSTAGWVGADGNANGMVTTRVMNRSAGNAAKACFLAGSSSSGTSYSTLCRLGPGHSTSGMNAPNRDIFRARGAGGLAVGTESNTPFILFANNVEVERVVPGAGMQSTTGTKPTCDATTRFLKVPVAGGAGVADTYEICLKGTADTYGWYPLATAP
jgi:hypothetical protein